MVSRIDTHKMPALMIQGCTSDAGKSTVVTGLCRILHRRNLSIAPFKPQNMALNSAVTIEGGEIGRAQAVQAQAAGLFPQIHMNPILLKPNNNTESQVIVQGFVYGNMEAGIFHDYKKKAMHYALDSFRQLQEKYSLIIIEGAGSPAEINLRENDIANMGFAEAIDCPVVIVADIDRGGVFAHLVGTLNLLSPSEQKRVVGFIINRFRGDITLLEPGIQWLEEYTNIPVLGVLPYLHNLHLEAEDAINSDQRMAKNAALKIIVPILPHISNHTDFDVLRLHPQIDLQFIPVNTTNIPAADLIILPGSKSVCADMAILKEYHWDKAIARHLRYGGKLIGICGGLQMLGQAIHDPSGIEGTAGSSDGLQLLDFETTLYPEKKLTNVTGHLSFCHAKVSGYEIHCGISTGTALDKPAVYIANHADGAISVDNNIFCTYLHGIFDEPEALTALLQWAGLEAPESFDYKALQEHEINRIANAIEQEINIDHLLETIEKFHNTATGKAP